MTTSPAHALQRALWQRLSADAALTALLGGPHIYDHVPRSAGLPYVTLGDIRSHDWSTQTARGHEHFLMLHVWSERRGRGEVQAIMAALDQALDGADLALVSHRLVNFSLVFWDARREADVGMPPKTVESEQRYGVGRRITDG